MHGKDGRYTGAIESAKAYFTQLLENVEAGKFDARMAASFEGGFILGTYAKRWEDIIMSIV